MTTANPGYQQVTVVTAAPTANPPTRRFNTKRNARIGSMAIGLPCAVCLCIFGIIFFISGISMVALSNHLKNVNDEFDDDWKDSFKDSHSNLFGDDDDDLFDHDDDVFDPLYYAGIGLILFGLIPIIVSIVLCVVGYKQYQKLQKDEPGRVISTAPAVTVPPGSYQMAPPGPSQAQYAAGATGSPMKSPGGPSPYPQQAPYPQQGSYPQQGPYPPQGPYPQQGAYNYAPAHSPSHGPPPADAGLPYKAGVPGEVYQGGSEFERPPPYAP